MVLSEKLVLGGCALGPVSRCGPGNESPGLGSVGGWVFPLRGGQHPGTLWGLRWFLPFTGAVGGSSTRDVMLGPVLPSPSAAADVLLPAG